MSNVIEFPSAAALAVDGRKLLAAFAALMAADADAISFPVEEHDGRMMVGLHLLMTVESEEDIQRFRATTQSLLDTLVG
ncbi:MAG: hypothetical protein AB7E05_13890 [Sphingobium sp.]